MNTRRNVLADSEGDVCQTKAVLDRNHWEHKINANHFMIQQESTESSQSFAIACQRCCQAVKITMEPRIEWNLERPEHAVIPNRYMTPKTAER